MNALQIVRDRDGSLCRRCGVWCEGDLSRHHRRPRGMGGTKTPDTPSRIVTLCGSGVTGCHGWVESNRAAAMETGWLVSLHCKDPLGEIPMTDVYGQVFLLDDDGGVRVLVAPDRSF